MLMTQVVQELTPMTSAARKETCKRIEQLRTSGCTNLWAGIRSGLSLFDRVPTAGNVQGMFVLTDGMPNHMCPKQGYVAKLGPMLKTNAFRGGETKSAPTIHTFGFGYRIKSALMQSIAEIGQGSYAFIPDAGMIGTVFIHAVANLFSTYSTCARVTMATTKKGSPKVVGGVMFHTDGKVTSIPLGNLQYGQSREFLVECPGTSGVAAETLITIAVNSIRPDGTLSSDSTHHPFMDTTRLPPAVIDYHCARAQICEYLSSLFPVQENGEHMAIDGRDALALMRTNLDALVTKLQRLPTKDTQGLKALLEDLVGKPPATTGQVFQALLSTNPRNYWAKWGRHYLPSLLHAHQRQVCNSFKDPGPLLYGKDSPLFQQCRDELDQAFDNLPQPKPSLPERVVQTYDRHGSATGSRSIPHSPATMSRYNSSAAPCFEGHCKVKIDDTLKVPVKSLKPGMRVWTPVGQRRVVAVIKTRVRSVVDHKKNETLQVCRVGKLFVTPWHPIKHEGRWKFPNDVSQGTVNLVGGHSIYSVLLAPCTDADGHVIQVGGQLCVTLGHGIVDDKDDARSHPFLGDYRKVVHGIARLRPNASGQLKCLGLKKDAQSGLVCGFVGSMAVAGSRNIRAHMRMRPLARIAA
jgi:hypothetical protein